MTSWIGVFAPAGTPRPIVERLQQEIARALADPRVREQLVSQAADPVASKPDDFARFTADETEKWAPVVKASGASVS
ncbi:Tripartite tricarboxylate transporter family receptor [compost metagenome]